MEPVPTTQDSGPREPITPLDPDTPEGREAAEALSQALAEILPKVLARRRVAAHKADTGQPDYDPAWQPE